MVMVLVPGYPTTNCLSGLGAGYTNALMTQVFTYGSLVAPSIVSAGAASYIDFTVTQSDVSSADLSAISTATGVPTSELPLGGRLVEQAMGRITTSPSLPLGITVSASLGVAGGRSVIRFMGDLLTLSSFVNGALAGGVVVHVPTQFANVVLSADSGSHVEFTLRSMTSPYLAVSAIGVGP